MLSEQTTLHSPLTGSQDLAPDSHGLGDANSFDGGEAKPLDLSNPSPSEPPQPQTAEGGLEGSDSISTTTTTTTTTGSVLAEFSLALVQQERKYQLQEEERRERVRLARLDKLIISPSYYTTSPKEYLVQQYIENFDRQYMQLYPGRKPIGFIRPNEFGVSKFVSSTIRPTQLPFKELYDFRSCARFVADFIHFSPLEPAHEMPRTFVSPSYTIALQQGNSFDMSTLLVSLLTGVGYDAYVVSGYAVKDLTTLDQTRSMADLKELVPSHFVKKNQGEAAVGPKSLDVALGGPVPSKYKVKHPKQLRSQFLIKQEERLKSLAMLQEKRQKEADAPPVEAVLDDELNGLRIHGWVLVLPGKREVSEAFFIESTTGEIFDCEASQYLGLESVWSPANFWVNMQICYDGLKGITFDLGDTMKWEFVLLDNTLPNNRNKNGEEPLEEDEEEGGEKQNEIVDVPPSWVDQLVVTLDQFESKCPTGGKATQYRNAKSEVFADYHRSDGMVQRVLFNDHDKDFANMTVETFTNRKDKLFQRVKLADLIHEFFHPGRTHGLREHIMTGGTTKQMNFYGSARSDGLIRRTEEPRKIIYIFEDREDRMVYRSITYEPPKGEIANGSRGQMLKMTEKFLRDPDTPANQDFAKKTYYAKEDRIRVVFHLGDSRIIPSMREFRKPPADHKGQFLDILQDFVVDPYAKKMKQQHMYAQMLDLLRSEQVFLQAIKNYERELSEILQIRLTEEQELSLSISIYDTLRNEVKMPEVEQGGSKGSRDNLRVIGDDDGQKVAEIDYLSPFLINYELINRMLAKDDALVVKEACLKSLRERLVEKANIIQGRLDETTEVFQQRQLSYSKNADSMTTEETDQYVEICNDALFKIHILEKRLAKHKESAPDRYIELESKLRSDARVALAF